MPIDVSPWFEFGFPAALLVAILTGLFVGARWFLKRYLDQQEEEFKARLKEREHRESIINKQQEFIKTLATNALTDMQGAIQAQSKTAEALDSICKMINDLAAKVTEHETIEEKRLDVLHAGHREILAEMRELEKAAMVSHKTYGGD